MASKFQPEGQPRSARFHDDGARHTVLRLVCGQAERGIFINLLVWALLLLGLREEVFGAPRWLLFGAAFAASIPRLWMAIAYKRTPGRLSITNWERLFAGTIVLSCFVWGAGGLYLLPRISPLLQLLLFIYIVGIASGTAILYFAQARAVILSVICILVPTSSWFVINGGSRGWIVGAAGLLIVVMTIRAVRLHSGLLHGYYQLVQQIDVERSHAEHLARTDQLTGLANRRAFHETSELAISQAIRRNSQLTLLLLDLDDFKAINDEHGHETGDEALQAFADVLRETARDADPVGRLGGDEFAVLLTETDSRGATLFADRLRQALQNLSVAGTDHRLRCSLGAAELKAGEQLRELSRRADQALYESKRTGKDRILVDEGAADSLDPSQAQGGPAEVEP